MDERSIDPLIDITPEQRDKMIEDVAQRIFKFGMATPAILFLEANKPLGRIAGNALHVLSPGLGVFFPNIDQYGFLLQDRINLEILIDRLMQLETERVNQERALRSERKARAKARKMRAQGLPTPEDASAQPPAGDGPGKTPGGSSPPGASSSEDAGGSSQ